MQDSMLSIVLPVVALLLGVVGFTWQRLRTSAKRRRAALDAYAEREIASAAAHFGRLGSKRRPARIQVLDKP